MITRSSRRSLWLSRAILAAVLTTAHAVCNDAGCPFTILVEDVPNCFTYRG